MRLRTHALVVSGLALGASLAACTKSGGGGSGAGSTVAAVTSSSAPGSRAGSTPGSTSGMPAPVAGNGPRVIFEDQLAPGVWQPSPFPSDYWTTPDPTTTTGLRVNLPYATRTRLEAQVASGIDDLDGFGTSSPIAVRFDGPLDLTTITRESVLVVNVQPGHPHFGQFAKLDVGASPAFPVKLETPHALFSPVEPFAGADDIVFRPGNRATFYEDETDTLLLRPLVPLDEAAEHAVVVMTDVHGTSGDSVRPPASASVLPGQSAGVARAIQAVAALGLRPDHVSFAWTFTTQSITAVPLALAEGLHGRGAFASLATQYPPRFDRIDDLAIGSDPHVLDVGLFRGILTAVQPIAAMLAPSQGAGSTFGTAMGLFGSGIYDFDSVGHVVFGSFKSPSFVKGGGGRFHVSLAQGTAAQVPDDVTFLVAVPKPTAANGYRQPPYPCVVFGHGINRCRIDSLGVATVLARSGFATVSIDAFGHGPDDTLSHMPATLAGLAANSPATDASIRAALEGMGAVSGGLVNPFDPIDVMAKNVLGKGVYAPLAARGRAIDHDGDGSTDSGMGFFHVDATVTRDHMRQTALDTVQLCRILQACGTDVNGNGTIDREEGDFGQTGKSEIGGPGIPIHYVGQSLGSCIGAGIVALEPAIEDAVLNVAGSSLFDEATALGSLHVVTDRVSRQACGVAVSGELDPSGIGTNLTLETKGDRPTLGQIRVQGGSTVTLTDSAAGTSRTTTADASGQFFVPAECDPGDALVLAVTDLGGNVQTVPVIAPLLPEGGLALERNTPAFRSFLGVGAMVLDGAESLNFAPCWRTSPLPGRQAKRVLVQLSRNDWALPVATGINLARAAGFVTPVRDDLLRTLGYPYGKTTANVDRDYAVESTTDFGVRFFCVDDHMFLNLPNGAIPDGALYTEAAQQQAATFLSTGTIDDSFPILHR